MKKTDKPKTKPAIPDGFLKKHGLMIPKGAVQLHETAISRFRVPDVRFDFGLVGYGYQVDVYVDGQPLYVACRDFSGSHGIKKMSKDLAKQGKAAVLKAMEEVIKKFRESH